MYPNVLSNSILYGRTQCGQTWGRARIKSETTLSEKGGSEISDIRGSVAHLWRDQQWLWLPMISLFTNERGRNGNSCLACDPNNSTSLAPRALLLPRRNVLSQFQFPNRKQRRYAVRVSCVVDAASPQTVLFHPISILANPLKSGDAKLLVYRHRAHDSRAALKSLTTEESLFRISIAAAPDRIPALLS